MSSSDRFVSLHSGRIDRKMSADLQLWNCFQFIWLKTKNIFGLPGLWLQQTLKLKYSHSFVFRHSQCELDKNCPYLILLECIDSEQNDTNEKEKIFDAKRLECIDQHFVSYLHDTDFHAVERNDPNKRRFHLTKRTRRLINASGIDMGRPFWCFKI